MQKYLNNKFSGTRLARCKPNFNADADNVFIRAGWVVQAVSETNYEYLNSRIFYGVPYLFKQDEGFKCTSLAPKNFENK
jgi:hypothetical protein